jgi:serine/threonine protein phosphatase PrpC
VNYSGTTALIVLVTSTQIFTFNIGNSRAIIGL